MKLSVIILTKNEEKQIEACLKSVSFADEIVVVDSGSTDRTLDIVKIYTDKIIKTKFTNFSSLRNLGLEKTSNDWVLYIDADEEITSDLKGEIETSDCNFAAYYITRQNFYLGRRWPTKDKVERLFNKEKLKKWFGDVHESPEVNGEKGELNSELIHRTHNSLEEMLNNTIVWSDCEARARFNTNHPKITWWRILRMMGASFYDYYIRQKGYRVGTAGLIESIYQAFSVFTTYGKLWELQQKHD